MVAPDIVLVGLIACTACIVGVISVLLFHAVHMNTKKAMASFQLNPDATVTDFRILLYAHLFQVASLIILGFSGVYESTTLRNISRMMTLTYAIVATSVFYRWWRRF